MRRFQASLVVSAIVVGLGLLAGPVFGQERASIVGQVTDSTGLILPGVTVQASSPALIEKTREAITDGSGRYAIIDLRPGTYVVTFELTGFRKIQREGIELEGSFTAQVNASLQIGSLEETITVAGTSPIVDVQSTQNQTVLNREVLNVLQATRTMQGGASLVPGVSFYSQGFVSSMSVHGSATADQHIYFDGMNIGQNLTGSGSQGNGVGVNELAQTELVFDAGSQSAENALGGVRMDSIPKEGGNNFSGVWRTFGSRGSFQNNNITDELLPFISQGTSLDYNYDTNAVFGGPLKKDRIWFLFAQRVSQSNNIIPLPAQYFAGGGETESGGQIAPHSTIRLTFQANQKNKIVFAFYKSQGGTRRFDAGCSATSGNSVACVSPEASYWLPTPLQYAAQLKWTTPVTSRFLIEVGQSLAVPTYKFNYQPENSLLDISHNNSTTGVRTVASATAPNDYFNMIWNTVANISYVTGSHNYKFGVNQQWGYSTLKVEPHGDAVQMTLVNNAAGVATPSSVTLRNSPYIREDRLKANLGIFGQDKWTIGPLTLLYGGRYDYFNGYAPAEHAPAGRYVGERDSPETPCIPCWNDWSVRVGASYDLFGTGKTALKTSIGKFLGQQALGLTATLNPMTGQTDTRTWTDRDGNNNILDANGVAQVNEFGASPTPTFGIPGASAKIAEGLPRPSNWEESVSVQHELLPRVSITAGYYRRQFYDIQYTDNRSLDATRDFVPFNVTIPVNANNPGGGGQVVTLYNLCHQDASIGPGCIVTASNNFTTASSNNTRVYNGLEVSVNARLPRGFVFGGITTERTATNNCTDLTGNNPNTPLGGATNFAFCNQIPPFRTLYKVSAGFTLPYQVQVSGSFQARPGIPIGGDYRYTCNAAAAASTGCTALTSNVAAITVTVVDPTSTFYDYVKSNDMRVSRTFKHGRLKFQPFLEIFNVANLSTVLTVNETIGGAGSLYGQPVAIVQGRRMQLGGQIDW